MIMATISFGSWIGGPADAKRRHLYRRRNFDGFNVPSSNRSQVAAGAPFFALQRPRHEDTRVSLCKNFRRSGREVVKRII